MGIRAGEEGGEEGGGKGGRVGGEGKEEVSQVVPREWKRQQDAPRHLRSTVLPSSCFHTSALQSYERINVCLKAASVHQLQAQKTNAGRHHVFQRSTDLPPRGTQSSGSAQSPFCSLMLFIFHVYVRLLVNSRDSNGTRTLLVFSKSTQPGGIEMHVSVM